MGAAWGFPQSPSLWLWDRDGLRTRSADLEGFLWADRGKKGCVGFLTSGLGWERRGGEKDQSPRSTAGFEESCGAQGQRPHVAGAGAHSTVLAVPRGP